MLFAPAQEISRLTAAERRRAGRELRRGVPRRAHAHWAPPPGRRDPVQLLIDTGQHRIQRLLPLRYGRMRANAFAFLRGAAAIMAADLATTPTTGQTVQAGGDCHLANFGAYASPEGTPVFDINDFDETTEAPFEWDLKRLAASFAVAARSRRLSDRRAGQLAEAACRAYRTRMAELARMDPMRAWRARIPLADALEVIGDTRVREREKMRLFSIVDAYRSGYPKLLERRNGALRIKLAPPYTFPLADEYDRTLELAARAAFDSYRASLREELRLLLERYQLTDLAFKVVGVGSVGTFCALGLFTSPDGGTLLLQLKEAQPSALEPYTGRSPYANHGQRVVVGQRIMQAVSDPFLGWTNDHGDDRPCYVRQLKDGRMAMIGQSIADAALEGLAHLCGNALARAHARSQDPARLSGYMGAGISFDTAITEFAMSYAEQTERDYLLFLEAIKSGLIEAATP